MPSDTLSGMTVNERLFVLGLLEEFDVAARARDRARMIEILARAEVGSETADQLLASPERYGY
jgi:hypothetical protein